MIPIPIPPEAAASRPYCVDISMGPPPGVSDEDCGTVQMLREPARPDQPVGPAHYAYFRPTASEIAALGTGGFLELALAGGTVQPFSLAVWPAAGGSDAWHGAEAFKQGWDSSSNTLRFGWQCLRCGLETLIDGDAAMAERLAFQHNAEQAGLVAASPAPPTLAEAVRCGAAAEVRAIVDQFGEKWDERQRWRNVESRTASLFTRFAGAIDRWCDAAACPVPAAVVRAASDPVSSSPADGFERNRETSLAAAAALMGMVNEVNDIEVAQLIAGRAMQFEQEAAALPTAASQLADAIRRRRFDVATGRVNGPDSFYAGILLAEAIARGEG
ncbi:MAG: hypothetical protein ABI047_03285 [Jatrophihabitantaceae bacterium]